MARERIRSLILGCGPNWPKRPATHSETLVDIRSFGGGVDVVTDLNAARWPFEDGSFDEIVATHLIEHLLNLVGFMDECHRILAPGGALYLTTPEAGNDLDLTHGDPTHVRTFRLTTFKNYFLRSEAPKFCYTDRFWAPLELAVRDGVIYFHAVPVK